MRGLARLPPHSFYVPRNARFHAASAMLLRQQPSGGRMLLWNQQSLTGGVLPYAPHPRSQFFLFRVNRPLRIAGARGRRRRCRPECNRYVTPGCLRHGGGVPNNVAIGCLQSGAAELRPVGVSRHRRCPRLRSFERPRAKTGAAQYWMVVQSAKAGGRGAQFMISRLSNAPSGLTVSSDARIRSTTAPSRLNGSSKRS